MIKLFSAERLIQGAGNALGDYADDCCSAGFIDAGSKISCHLQRCLRSTRNLRGNCNNLSCTIAPPPVVVSGFL
jgi:hypothetical protein